MRAKFVVGLALMTAAVLPIWAHHSFSAEFDNTKPIILTGTVTKVEWMNPHIWIYLDAKDEKGATSKWQCEGGAPNGLIRNGWGKADLKAGDPVTIDGSLAKDGSNTCNARQVSLPGGKRVFAGSSGGDDAAKGAKAVTVGKQ